MNNNHNNYYFFFVLFCILYHTILYFIILYYIIPFIPLQYLPCLISSIWLCSTINFSHFCHISFHIISPHFNCSTTTDPIGKVNHKYNSRHIGKVEKTLSDRVSPPHPFSVDTHSKWAADKRVISVQKGKCKGGGIKKNNICYVLQPRLEAQLTWLQHVPRLAIS